MGIPFTISWAFLISTFLNPVLPDTTARLFPLLSESFKMYLYKLGFSPLHFSTFFIVPSKMTFLRSEILFSSEKTVVPLVSNNSTESLGLLIFFPSNCRRFTSILNNPFSYFSSKLLLTKKSQMVVLALPEGKHHAQFHLTSRNPDLPGNSPSCHLKTCTANKFSPSWRK